MKKTTKKSHTKSAFEIPLEPCTKTRGLAFSPPSGYPVIDFRKSMTRISSDTTGFWQNI